MKTKVTIVEMRPRLFSKEWQKWLNLYFRQEICKELNRIERELLYFNIDKDKKDYD